MKFFIFCVSLIFCNDIFAQKEIQKQINNNKKNNTIVNNKPHLLYIVKTNDTYHTIAKANNLTVNRLYELNAIDNSNILLVGTSLFIKDLTVKRKKINTKANSYHLVKEKETLYSIAKKYNTSITQLLVLNNLNSNAIFLGQQLRVR